MTFAETEKLVLRFRRLARERDRSDGEEPEHAWGMLTRDWLRNALRQAVRLAESYPDQENALHSCWALAQTPACRETIERAQTHSSVDCRRLHHNLGGLIATAGAAAAAVRALNRTQVDGDAPARIGQWLERAALCFKREWSDGRLESPPAGDWTLDSPEDLIRAAGRRLAGEGMPAENACHWALHWLGDQSAPGMIIPLAVREAGTNRGRIVELRLRRAEGSALIEHYDVALQPTDGTLLDALRAAHQMCGIGAVWSIRDRDENRPSASSIWHVALEGASLELASHVAFLLLKEDRRYDASCLLIGRMRGGAIVKVEGEEVKLRTASQTQAIRRVGLATDAAVGDALDYSRLQIRRVRTLAEAADYASGLITQVYRVLTGEIEKVVADAGRRLGGRRVERWEDLERLNVPVQVARGIRPLLREDQLRELEQRRSLGDYSGQNIVEQQREDLRRLETQERLPHEKRRRTARWDSIRRAINRGVITGDPGYGKTMLSWLEMEENRESLAELETLHSSIYDIRFSIWTRAAELAIALRGGSALDASVEEASRAYDLNEDGRHWLREQLTNGHGRIVLDALDEVPISDRRELDQAIGQLPPATRLLMTSRLVGYTKAPAGVPPENELEVLAFGDREMQQAIRRWFDVKQEIPGQPSPENDQQAARAAASLWDHIREHWMIREILHCPLLLRLACAAADRLQQQHRKLPRWKTRAELYETFLDQSIERMVEKTGLRSAEYAAIERDIRIRSADDPIIPILKRVLTQMRAGAEVRASMRDFAADLSLALWRLDARRTFWEEGADLRKGVAQAAAPYRALVSRPDLLEDLKAADILTPATSEKETDPALMYTHRTIGEYLTARSLAVKLKSSNEVVEWKFVDKKAWDPYWKPVLLFLAGQLSDDVETLNRYITLLSRPETDPWEDDLFSHRLCLAVEALAEVPPTVRPALDGHVDMVTKAIYELYWKTLSEDDALGALPHSTAAWRAAGRLNGFVEKLRLIPHLVECLINVDSGTRILAAQALAHMGEVAARDDRVIPTLVDRVSDENRMVRSSVAWALGQMRDAAWQDNEVPKMLTERLQDENHEIRFSAAQALGQMVEYAPEADQVIAALMERLGDEKGSVRENAALALGQMKEAVAQDERVMASLIELLENDAFEVRESAGTVLGSLGEAAASNKRVMAALADQLGNENWQVRQNAAWTIGRMGEPAARDERVTRTLVEWLAAEGWLERRTAASVLGGMGEAAARNDQVIASLTAQLGDENWQVRLNAAWALGRMGQTIAQNPKVMSALLLRLSDEHSQVRLNAARAFGKMGEAAARNKSIMFALLGGLNDSAWQVCYRSALALARMGKTASGDERVRAALVRGLRSKTATDRRIAAQALGEMGRAVAHDHSVIAALIERLDDESWEVREKAAYALGEMGEAGARDERVVPTLLKWREQGVISAASVLGMFFRTGARVFQTAHPQTSVATRWVDELARCDDLS